MRNVGGIGSSSIYVLIVRSNPHTVNVCPKRRTTSPHVVHCFMVILTCFCKNFFLHDLLSSEHLVSTQGHINFKLSDMGAISSIFFKEFEGGGLKNTP